MPTLSDLIVDAPAGERSLLELRATWDSLPDAHARVAVRLRVFVLNWDPLGWLGEPFVGSATATGDGDDYEVVLYAPLAAAAGLLDDLCRSVVDVGVSQELLLSSGAYAQLAFAGKVPDLLSAIGTLSATGAPRFELAQGGWEPIGLGAIQDLVQARFGPVDLDRSAVMLETVAEHQPACAACAGRRFGFPAELADELAAMCAPHARQATELTSARLACANASNHDGWYAIVEASDALHQPTYGMPLKLLGRLEQAVDRVDPSLDALRGDAATALELAGRLRGREADFENWADDWMARDWMFELPWMLARRDMTVKAVQVADAFAQLDHEHDSAYAGDAAVMLAEAGYADEARARVHANLSAFAQDIWTHVHAGDVHRLLDDPEQAEQAFRRAVALAQTHGEQQDTAIATRRLADLLATVPGRESDARQAAAIAARALAAERGQRVASKTGRNDPCPCGSASKFKKCCGA